MLSLIKAGRRHTTVETLSHSLPRPKTDGMFAPQISGITDANIRLPKTIQLLQHHATSDSNYQQDNLRRKLGTLHEMQPVDSVTAPRVSLEMGQRH